MDIIVGIGEYAITNNALVKLKTFALASCVAVTAYSAEKKAAGMIHIVLPHPQRPEDAVKKPVFYASTGIPLLIKSMCRKYGCRKEELSIGVFGGAASKHKNDFFAIGEKNLSAVYSVMKSLSLRIGRKEVGGEVSRSLEMDVATGNVKVFAKPLL